MTTIVVADDDSDLRATLRTALEACGYAVSEAADGIECERLIRSVKPDVILLDVFMPNKDGLEVLCSHARSHDRPAIVCMSGGGSLGRFDSGEVARKLGARHYLSKPFRMVELLQLLAEILGSPGQESARTLV
jgi:DNA-binding response OmpR family regulator